MLHTNVTFSPTLAFSSEVHNIGSRERSRSSPGSSLRGDPGACGGGGGGHSLGGRNDESD